MTESIDLPFGMWTRVGRRKHKLNRIRQMAPMCPTTPCRELCNKSLAVAKMGDRLATIDIGRKVGDAVRLSVGGAGP